MARDSKYDILFEPVQIGAKVLRNRFYQVPHCSGFGTEKPGSQARHRAVKAEGGWAAVCTEFAPIAPDSDESPSISARFWDEDDGEALSLMCDEIHEVGSLAGIELHHAGAHAHLRESRWPAIAPSQIASDLLTPFQAAQAPKAMDRDDIERVKAEWVRAALGAREAGFDIVYVYGGHSYLLAQFLSPYYNKRRDQYGGSLENRARLWLETLDRVRSAVGSSCAIAVRIASNAMGPAGVSLDETLQFIRMADELVDLWDVNVGSLLEWKQDSGSSRFFSEGYQLEFSGQARRATKKPIVGVGRLTNPDKMVEIIRSGAWDIIGGARPSIADPFLPSKIEEGRLDDIRECMGINACTGRSVHGMHLGCAQNATAGEEFRRGWHPERYSRAENADSDVLIVGAGPAGLECAMVLGRRGMRRVHLVEKEREIGGAMRWIPRLPGLGEWARLVNYRRIQLDKLRNVEVITGVDLDARAAAEYGADLVVVATGSRWADDGISGVSHAPVPGADATLPHVLTPEQVMVEGKRPAGRDVVVYDCEGYFMGAGLAELLAGEGFSVELVTALGQVAPFTDETLEGPLLRQHLHERGIMMRRGTTLTEIGPGRVSALDEFGESLELEASAVVLVTQRVSNEGLYRELRDSGDLLPSNEVRGLYRVGDCVAPRLLPDAVFDGHRLGREIDSPDPATPLPYVRERALRKTLTLLSSASVPSPAQAAKEPVRT